jgi:ferric-dicitrate binding protein FerR (iron transport regulator)
MKNYTNFSVEDFIQDAYFRQWAFDELSSDDTFWENWIQLNPEKLKVIEEAKSLVIALKIKQLDVFSAHEINEGIQDILNATLPKNTHSSFLRTNWLRLAASVALVFGIGWWFMEKDKSNNAYFDQITATDPKAIHTNNGRKSISFELVDGSKITLEPGSELRYGNEFGDEKREVFLSGEAFFEVKKDSQRPFLIYTGKLVTKVVGTSFRIKAYEQDDNISVSVRTGKVTVYRQNSKIGNSRSLSTEIVLIPNQKAVFEKDQELIIKTLVETPVSINETSQNTSLAFEETKISDVFSRLEGIYGIKIDFDKEVFSKCSVTAHFNNESLYQKLDIICEIVRAKYEIIDGEIMIFGNGCQ